MARERKNFYISTSLHLAAHMLASHGCRWGSVRPAVVQGGEGLCYVRVPARVLVNKTASHTSAFNTSITQHDYIASVSPKEIGQTLSSNLLRLHLFLSLHVHFFPTTPHFYSIFTLSTTSYFSSFKFLQLAAGIILCKRFTLFPTDPANFPVKSGVHH